MGANLFLVLRKLGKTFNAFFPLPDPIRSTANGQQSIGSNL